MPSARRIFIIVPSATPSSPMKGAAALANALSRERSVCLVALKSPVHGFDLLDARVDRIALSDAGAWHSRFLRLRKLLRDAGGRREVAAVSLCLSADVVSGYCRDLAVTCASVRGNIAKVYPETYGAAGRWMAHRHLHMLRRLDHVVSMTRSMAEQVQRHTGKSSPVIGNFVDESSLAPFRQARPEGEMLRFVFTGSMIRGKQPQIVLDAFRSIQAQGIRARLDMFGDGPMLRGLKERTRTLPDASSVLFHGHVAEPFATVAKADALVLPSLTEGVSRSALEAMFLGVPCVLRDVDGNSELVRAGDNGMLFERDADLPETMLKVARSSQLRAAPRDNLLPAAFRQDDAAARYLALLESDG
jgi:glycosyltransferase involved in cell wall biosynthesis